jgi:type IV/VI secretion system ImpK/VasF family protein
MNLLELCEPLFLYICRLSRSARKAGQHEMSAVRGEVQALLAEMKSRAGADPHLLTQYEKVELPLVFFVDFMVKESQLRFARQWQELAFERKELAGDEKFFDLLEETLADTSPPAGERLAVFYVCMGLGFTGIYTGQPEYLRKMMLQCSARLREFVAPAQLAKVCPEAYEHVDASNLVTTAGSKLVGIVIALIGLVVVLFVANIYLFNVSSDDLSRALNAVRSPR